MFSPQDGLADLREYFVEITILKAIGKEEFLFKWESDTRIMILVSSSLKMLTKIFLSLLPQNILKNPRAPISLSTLLIADWYKL